MKKCANLASQLIGAASVGMIAIAVVMATSNVATAGPGSGTTDCINGGGANTKCVAFDSDNDGVNDQCTLTTQGKQCDVESACSCTRTTQNPCKCS